VPGLPLEENKVVEVLEVLAELLRLLEHFMAAVAEDIAALVVQSVLSGRALPAPSHQLALAIFN
jgi:hypothetical protein